MPNFSGYEDTRKKSVDGPNLMENTKINKSLYALQNVVYALSVNESHVPYRESKLTRMLQDSFGGMNQILMVTCLVRLMLFLLFSLWGFLVFGLLNIFSVVVTFNLFDVESIFLPRHHLLCKFSFSVISTGFYKFHKENQKFSKTNRPFCIEEWKTHWCFFYCEETNQLPSAFLW